MFNNKVTFDVKMWLITPYIGGVCQREIFFDRKAMNIEDILAVVEELKPCIDMDDENIGQIFMAMYKATRDFEREDYSSISLEPFCVSYSTLPLESYDGLPSKKTDIERRARATNYFGISGYKLYSSIDIWFDPVYKVKADA